MYTNKANLVDYLIGHSLSFPHKTAFVMLKDGEDVELEMSYRTLASGMIALAAQLTARHLNGKRALLVYPDTSEFIVAFMACQYAGVIAVPVPYVKGKKQIERLLGIIADAHASVILCTATSIAPLQQGLGGFAGSGDIELIATDEDPSMPFIQGPVYNEIAFIQYTSGSTGKPKGVVITSKNLLHNQQLIQQAFGCDQGSVIFSWLPFHHDMGLIGNILHTIYTGCTCILMSPFHFMQKPKRWLDGVSRYKATHSGGPNFAYDLCVEKIAADELSSLDLSGWQVAYNGSEPIRSGTISRFCDHFQSSRFDKNAFSTCYGLAEATLLVSAKRKGEIPWTIYIDRDGQATQKFLLTDKQNVTGRPVVSSGKLVEGMDVKIVAIEERRECADLEEGEICIYGESVTRGYWNMDNSDLFVVLEDKPFLRTGDLGFFLNGDLFVHGRSKEMLIIRGRNLYPADMEGLIASHGVIETNGVAIFTLNKEPGADPSEDHIVIAAEIKRTRLKDLDAGNVISYIDRTMNGSFGIDPYDIILTTPLGLPRTTSGKLQRVKCREYYSLKTFSIIASKLAIGKTDAYGERDSDLTAEVIRTGDYHTIKRYLTGIIESKVGRLPENLLHDNAELTEMGIDSLRAMELINIINKDLDINMDATKIFRDNTLPALSRTLENMLWLKNGKASGQEITL